MRSLSHPGIGSIIRMADYWPLNWAISTKAKETKNKLERYNLWSFEKIDASVKTSTNYMINWINTLRDYTRNDSR